MMWRCLSRVAVLRVGFAVMDVGVVVRRFAVPLALVGVALLSVILAGVTGSAGWTVVALVCLVLAAVRAVRIVQEPERLPVSTVPVSDAVRQERLQEALSYEVVRGRVESVTNYSAVVVSGQRVNHVLHLLISVLLCGLWLPVWFLIAVSNGERRRVLTVDRCGNVVRS